MSQSECRTAQDCGTRWLAEWWLGVRHVTPESTPQRVGSIGHAVVAETLLARHEGRDPDTAGAITAECERRRYDLGLDDPEVLQAEEAAETLLLSGKFAPGRAVMMLSGEPLIEHRVRATWAAIVASGATLGPLLGMLLPDRIGMEGQPDSVHERGGVVFVDDYKFRQKIDLGGAAAQSTLPDSQGAFYKVLLRAACDHVRVSDVVFRQINVYAGPWLTLEDFLGDGSPYVTSNGIPSRDLKVLGMVASDVWEDAWRVLVERRRVASTVAVTTTAAGRPRKPSVRLASEAEQRDAAAFIETLRRIPRVEVSEFRLDHSVCVEVVRDMLASVAGLLATVRAGARPGRHLRTYPTSPCARRYGCQVQEACLASLGTGRIEATLAEMAQDGRLRRAWDVARDASIADHAATP